MESAESIKRKLATVEDLKSVARTMKALAAVNIHRYEKAEEALMDYNRAIEMGLRIVLRARPNRTVKAKPAPRKSLISIVFGSDQGMCGQFNEQIALFAKGSLADLNNGPGRHVVPAVGSRVASSLENAGLKVEDTFAVPWSAAGITALVEDLLSTIEDRRAKMQPVRQAATERAEKNIQERLEELTRCYHQERQTAMTQELLEIVAGFEVQTSSK